MAATGMLGSQGWLRQGQKGRRSSHTRLLTRTKGTKEQPYTAADKDERDEGDETGSGTVVQTIAFAIVR